MTTNIKKLNTLVSAVFGPEVENMGELWLNNADVQKDIKALFALGGVGGRKKDPNAPKRGKSSYLFFCAALRDTVKTSLGAESKATEVTKELGVRWNKLKASTKASDKKALAGYAEEAAADKARYDGEKVNYVPEFGDDVVESKRRGGKKAPKDGPKRTKSSYLFFCEANRGPVKANDPSLKATEVTSELGRLWNELKADNSRADELAKFSDLAAADTVRYEQEKANTSTQVEKVTGKAGKAVKTEKTEKAVKAVKTEKSVKTEKVVKAEKAVKAVKSVKAVKGKVVEEQDEEELLEDEDVKFTKKTSESDQGGFQAFSSEKRSEIKQSFPKMKAGEITKKISSEWKSLSKEEQKQWKQSVSA